MLGYIKWLVSDYGISEYAANTAIMCWAAAMGIEIEAVNIVDEAGKKRTRNNTIEEYVDYSSVSSDMAIAKGKIIKLTGVGSKVYPGVIIPKGTYIVKEMGGVCAKFYDTNNEYTFIVNELSTPEFEKVFQTPSRMTFEAPGTLEIQSYKNWSLIMKPIG